MHASPRGTQEATRRILRSLFPPWLPPAFALLFSRPMPELSCQVEGLGSGVAALGRRRGRLAGATATSETVSAVVLLRLNDACASPSHSHPSTPPLTPHPPTRPPPPFPPPQQLNAWATWLTCQWLMGECELNDVEVDGGRLGRAHGVLVKR